MLALKKGQNANTPANEEVKVAQKQEAMKVEAAAVATTPTYDESILCSKSDKVVFISPLGDPSHKDVTVDKTTGEKTVTPYIVGYRFKALEDMEVPDCGLGDDARKNLMSFADINGKKLVKAGEEFDLTRFEAGLLFAPPEFNGRITGGGKSFTVVYQTNSIKSKSGKLGDASAAAEIPTISIKADAGSLKDYAIIEVLTFTATTSDNGTIRKDRKILPGFEKWEPLCRVQTRVSSGVSSTASKTTRNSKADSFLQIVAKKQQKNG